MKSKSYKKLVGIVKRHADGFGFFIPDDKNESDAYITKPDMRGLMTRDRVEVEVRPEPGGKRFRGKVVKVLQRSFEQAVGQVYLLKNDVPYLLDSSHSWGADLRIESQDELEEGTWVAARIKTFPDHPKGFTGELITVIGDGMKASSDNLRIILSHQIPNEFSKECLSEAKALSDETIKTELKNRKDLRDLHFITIDGATAKDFDDAVLVTKTKKGFNCKVAIADVSFYVEQNGAIDKDADQRGTSTYLPNFVNPMLPEELSNELCSLKPKVDRLALVADIEMDHNGSFLSYSFYEAVIHSHARVTYGEAQEIIEGYEETPHKHVVKDILVAADLSRILMKKRFNNGSLDLEIPETQVHVDDAGEVVDISLSQRLFAHKLIEELMLAANVAVASFFVEKNIPGMFRTHEPPKPEMIDKLEVYLESLGVSTRIQRPGQQKKITKALSQFSGKPEHKVLSMLTLRSMSQAKYSLENIGHFGLGFNNYLHFTSPIRRYPDLVVHRQIKAHTKASKKYIKWDEEKIHSKATWFSACEQRSVKAERQLISIKKARFIRKFLGEEFDGYISGVAKFGLFISLRQFDIDGLVKVEDLPGDHYIYDEVHMCLKGRKSGVAFKIGEEVKIQVAAVNEEEGKIDFKPIFSEDFIKAVEKRAKENKSKDKDRGRAKRPKATGKKKRNGKKSRNPLSFAKKKKKKSTSEKSGKKKGKKKPSRKSRKKK